MRQAARRWFSPVATIWIGVSWVFAGKDQTYYYSCHDGGDEEGEVDLDVCEEDEPFISCALFQLAGAFGAANTASWIFAADSYDMLTIYLFQIQNGTYQFQGRTDIPPVP
jgi:hypothetical protein